MTQKRILPLCCFLSLATALALAGCKSSAPSSATRNPATAQSTTDKPAAGQSGSVQPGTSQPVGDGSAASAGSAAPTAGAPAANGSPQAGAPPPAVVVLSAGTHLRVRLDTELGSKISRSGDSFSATVADDVVENGTTVIPRGARAEGTVVDAKPLGHFKGGALLSIRLDRVHTRWGSYPVETSALDRAKKGKGKRTAGFIGGGAGLGALLGGLAGGGRGVAIGAVAGGGAGTAGAAFTGNKQIVLPAETLLTFRLEHSVHIVERP
ncbi:MAG TPA: hypothetical protein VE291_04155 [Terracidiphilus sp.]|jgi:hypothetical protein|nr:hypothetical protein [Terracidiphilus sp.]